MRRGIDFRGVEWEEIEISKKMIDISGQRFGNLVALFPVRSHGKVKWLCQCDCDNLVVVITAALQNGNTKSCGCLQRKKTENRWQEYREIHNVIGQTYGELTIIRFVGVEDGQAIYSFKCSCGKCVNLPIERVKRGNTSSCGHLWIDWNDSYKSDIIGQRFGRLVARNFVGIDKHGSTLFLCDCDCGNTTILPRYSLTENRTHSCGCIVSVGESNIKKILNDTKIKYRPQYVFKDLKSDEGGHLLYDFAIFDDDCNVVRLIEFDGKQHERPYDFFGGEEKFLKVKKNDALKNEYASSHNIPLVRLPYALRDTMTLEDLMGNKYLIKKNRRI